MFGGNMKLIKRFILILILLLTLTGCYRNGCSYSVYVYEESKFPEKIFYHQHVGVTIKSYKELKYFCQKYEVPIDAFGEYNRLYFLNDALIVYFSGDSKNIKEIKKSNENLLLYYDDSTSYGKTFVISIVEISNSDIDKIDKIKFVYINDENDETLTIEIE